MRVALVSVDNGFGLSRDTQYLKSVLHVAGIESTVVDVRSPCRYSSDVNVFLEVVDPRLFPNARHQVLIPNPEWWRAEWKGVLEECVVFAKTRDCERHFQRLGADVKFTGFVFQDRYCDTIHKRRSFLHIAGQSRGRFTSRIVNAWRMNPHWPPLQITAAFMDDMVFAHNIQVLGGHIDDAALRNLQNSAQFHLCISRYEGFGHTFWEAMSCGAVVVAADAAPANEIITEQNGVTVKASLQHKRMGLVQLADVRTEHITSAVERTLALSPSEICSLSSAARETARACASASEMLIVNSLIELCA